MAAIARVAMTWQSENASSGAPRHRARVATCTHSKLDKRSTDQAQGHLVFGPAACTELSIAGIIALQAAAASDERYSTACLAVRPSRFPHGFRDHECSE